MTKKFMLPVLLLLSLAGRAQQKMPLLKATTKSAYIIEGNDNTKRGWGLDPGAKPDVFKLDKILKPTWVKFYTDIDSLKVRMKPGQTFDFIVLLNGRDSCFTQFVSEAPILKYRNLSPATHDTIPFELTDYNNLKVKVQLNETDTLYLKFD